MSILGVSTPKMQRDTSWHGRQLWEEQNFVINHPAMFETLFLGLLFAVESKSGIKMLLNLLLLDIIGPKNATLFIRDQLQGVITSQPTAPPPPPPGNQFYCPYFWMISNLTSNYVFWNIAFIWCSHSPLAEYWVHCVELLKIQCMQIMFNNMVLDEQSCIFRANYLQQ